MGTLKMYDKGADGAIGVVRAAFEEGVKTVSFWCSSVSNLTSRNNQEVQALERVYGMLADRIVEDTEVHEQEVNVEIIGRWRELLSEKTTKKLENVIEQTKNYAKLKLVLLIGYDGVDERNKAVSELLESRETAENGNQLLKKHSWTGHLNDVDLIIRTGAWHDPHNSAGFLSLLTDNVQYEFPSVLWPEFTKEKVKEIINNFAERERRYGK